MSSIRRIARFTTTFVSVHCIHIVSLGFHFQFFFFPADRRLSPFLGFRTQGPWVCGMYKFSSIRAILLFCTVIFRVQWLIGANLAGLKGDRSVWSWIQCAFNWGSISWVALLARWLQRFVFLLENYPMIQDLTRRPCWSNRQDGSTHVSLSIKPKARENFSSQFSRRINLIQFKSVNRLRRRSIGDSTAGIGATFLCFIFFPFEAGGAAKLRPARIRHPLFIAF